MEVVSLKGKSHKFGAANWAIFCPLELINPFLNNVPITYPLKTTEKQRFSSVSGGIKWEHLPKMGQKPATKARDHNMNFVGTY